MARRHLLLRLTSRTDRRWITGALVVAVLVAGVFFLRRTGPAPPLDLLALGPDGVFEDTLRLPAEWADTAAATPDAPVRFPLILGARNRGRRPARPDRLALSLPVRYRLVAAGDSLEGRAGTGSPLITYVLRPGFDALEPGRLPALLPAHDTLWLEVVIPSYYCVVVADSIPELVPAPSPPLASLAELRIFYSFEGGDLGERRTGTLVVRLDTTAIARPPAPERPTFPIVVDADLAHPDLGPLTRVGSRTSRCGEPESPVELLSTVWATESGGRFITLDYGGAVRKRLYDLDGDGIIERESWAPTGAAFTSTRRASLPIPEFLLPVAAPAASDTGG